MYAKLQSILAGIQAHQTSRGWTNTCTAAAMHKAEKPHCAHCIQATDSFAHLTAVGTLQWAAQSCRAVERSVCTVLPESAQTGHVTRQHGLRSQSCKPKGLCMLKSGSCACKVQYRRDTQFSAGQQHGNQPHPNNVVLVAIVSAAVLSSA